MVDLTPFLKSLISAPGLSGHEEPVRKIIEEAWKPLVDELIVSRLGSLHGLKRGVQTSAASQANSLLIATHMDAIGMMVTGIQDGFLRFTEIGGLDPRVLPGQPVTVHGRRDLPGVIVQPPAHLLPAAVGDGPAGLEHLLIDTGLEPAQLQQLVRVGTLVSYAQAPLELGEEYLAGHTLDNRASVAALTECLQVLQGRQTSWDIWAVATTQEEETYGGAFTSAFQIRPSIAIAVDVTFASSPGSPSYETHPLGKGLTLAWGPNIHPALHRKMKEQADKLEIPYALEPIPGMTGTDANPIQVVAEGIPTMLVGIPLRYMHTPVEMVSTKDIRRVGRLLAEFAAQLDDTFITELKWDD